MTSELRRLVRRAVVYRCAALLCITISAALIAHVIVQLMER